jgi:hypothetical protein
VGRAARLPTIIAAGAHEVQTGEDWSFRPRVSYESGSSKALWPTPSGE